MLEIIFAGAEYFNEQEYIYIYVWVMIRELNLCISYPAQAWQSLKTQVDSTST